MNPETTASPEAQTERVLQNHLQAFASGDVDAIVDDYADDAVFITQDGVLRGRQEIRVLFQELVAAFPPGSAIDIQTRHVEGETAYLVWSGESETLRVPFATDTLVVRNGAIARQTFAAEMEEK